MPSVTTPQRQATGIHKFAVVISPENDEAINQVAPHLVENFYKKYGVVLLRGFKVDVDDFRLFTSQLCSSSVFNESGDRELIDASHNIQTVNLGKAAFALHPELAREPWKPDACFFTCMQAPHEGGETLVCDGVELFATLPAAIKETLSGKDFRYTSVAQPDELAYWLGTENPTVTELQKNRSGQCPFVFFPNLETKKIMRSFKVPAFHRTMFGNELAFGSFLLFARFNKRDTQFPTYGDFTEIPQDLVNHIQSAAQGIQVPVKWEEGDLLLIDNTRFMHGRNKVIDTSERKILSHFGFMRCADIAESEKKLPWRTEQWYARTPLGFHQEQSKQIDRELI